MRQFTPQTLIFIALYSVVGNLVYGQEQVPAATVSYENQKPRPSIEIGAGTLSYFGDVGNLNGNAQYSQLNWGYSITMRNPISDAFSIDFAALFGKVRHQENIPGQMVNFETPIQMGSASLTYNFNNLLPRQRSITPYLSVGIATMEFNPKADMRDADDNLYYVWDNGTLMNTPQKDAKSDEARPVYRDYNYETDWREIQGGSGAFSLRTLAIPVAAGANITVNDIWKVRMGASYLYTFTDNIDGINSETTGITGATNRKDALLFSSVGIAYNLHHRKKNPGGYNNLNDDYSPGLDLDDEDADGVVDLGDKCPTTPEGVKVDAFGCPVDNDSDGVADYLDDEINSVKGAVVNLKGVTVTDEELAKMYQLYIDPAGSPNYDKSQTYTADVNRNKVNMASRSKGYRVEVIDSDNMSPEDIARILSISDIKAIETDSGMDFYIDKIDNKYDAVQKFLQLNKLHIPARILQLDAGEYFELSESEIKHAAIFEEERDENAIVFRVQLGAFKYKLSRNVFKEVSDLLVIEGNDGLTRYVSGSFNSMQDAATHKVNLLLKGYEGAFVTAYRGGKRITLKEAGATVDAKEDITPQVANNINPNLVKYTLQLGTFTGRVPAETLGKYMSLGNVRPVRNTDGVTTYVYGSFNNHADAKAELANLKGKGFNEAIITGEFNGKSISAEEAMKIRGEN
jgi:hypothetical protein